MPTQVRCRECGHIMVTFQTAPTPDLWYSDLYTQLGGRCSRCGHKLPDPQEFDREVEVEVKPAEDSVGKQTSRRKVNE